MQKAMGLQFEKLYRGTTWIITGSPYKKDVDATARLVMWPFNRFKEEFKERSQKMRTCQNKHRRKTVTLRHVCVVWICIRTAENAKAECRGEWGTMNRFFELLIRNLNDQKCVLPLLTKRKSWYLATFCQHKHLLAFSHLDISLIFKKIITWFKVPHGWGTLNLTLGYVEPFPKITNKVTNTNVKAIGQLSMNASLLLRC